MDMGQGLFTAIGQMVAEELDVPFKSVKVIMGDTATSVNQGGASGSTGIQNGGKQMRAASAEARRVLIEMAAQKLNVPADQLTVTDGVVHAKSDPAKRATYAELIGGRYFNVQLAWNKQMGNALYAPGKAEPKKPSEYKIVGKPMPREDIAPMVYCETEFCTDVRRPGMLHARMIRPAVAGATPVKVDESSIKDIPGAQGLPGERLPRPSSPTRNGTRSRPRSSSRSSGRTPSRRSPTRPSSTITSATPRPASRSWKASRSATSTRRSRARRV